MQIHLIEKEKRFTCICKTSKSWESGFWKVSIKVAEGLIGGDIFLHTAQVMPSYFGGKITGYHIQDSGAWQGRVIFHFTATSEHKSVKTSKSGWGMEKKIVR